MPRRYLVRKGGPRPVSRFSIRELGPSTWPDFARIVEKHNGVWGGCWCISFHHKSGKGNGTAALNREEKEGLVLTNRAHAALVYDGADIAGWCQFGPPVELPGRMSAYGRLDVGHPDWRIPCFFVDRDHRKEGVAKAALEGALAMIAARGGGTVDAYPIETRGKPYSSSFLWGGTASMFEEAGFQAMASLGTSKLIMRKKVRPRTGHRV
jgi:GNAT superfamily N-acetyltransferase